MTEKPIDIRDLRADDNAIETAIAGDATGDELIDAMRDLAAGR